MKKTILAMILAAAMIISVCGCTANTATGTPSEKAKQYESIYAADSPYSLKLSELKASYGPRMTKQAWDSAMEWVSKNFGKDKNVDDDYCNSVLYGLSSMLEVKSKYISYGALYGKKTPAYEQIAQAVVDEFSYSYPLWKVQKVVAEHLPGKEYYDKAPQKTFDSFRRNIELYFSSAVIRFSKGKPAGLSTSIVLKTTNNFEQDMKNLSAAYEDYFEDDTVALTVESYTQYYNDTSKENTFKKLYDEANQEILTKLSSELFSLYQIGYYLQDAPPFPEDGIYESLTSEDSLFTAILPNIESNYRASMTEEAWNTTITKIKKQYGEKQNVSSDYCRCVLYKLNQEMKENAQYRSRGALYGKEAPVYDKLEQTVIDEFSYRFPLSEVKKNAAELLPTKEEYEKDKQKQYDKLRGGVELRFNVLNQNNEGK